MNFPLKDILKRQLTKKKPNVFNFEISKQNNAKNHLRRMLCNKNKFCKTLPFWLLKNLIIQFLESTWLKHLVTHFMSKICVAIKKNVFTKSFGSFDGKNEIRICLA
jgi:hypothetical protein